jgi:hypothetical protein
MRSVIVVAFLFAAAACGQAEYQQCDQACRNYVVLNYWNEWDPKIDAQPEAERAQLRHKKLAELNDILERGMYQCVQNCQIANNPDMNKCMIAAKTFAEARVCTGTEAEEHD